MRRMKSTNILLAVNAVLMSAVLWTNLAGGTTDRQPLLAGRSAHAQSPLNSADGVPNAGRQRQQTVEELRALNATVESLKSLLNGPAIKVQVMNLDEMKTASTPGGATSTK